MTCGRCEAVEMEMKGDSLLLTHGERALRVSTLCPEFVFEGESVGGVAPSNVEGDARRLARGRGMTLRYPRLPLDGGAAFLSVEMSMEWAPRESVLRKWARYRIEGGAGPKLLKEIVLEDLNTAASGPRLLDTQATMWPLQSYPVFLDGYFMGIEFPVSTTRIDGARVIVAHQPGIRLEPGTWRNTRKAVYGVTSVGGERRAFDNYIIAHCPGGMKRRIIWSTFFGSYSFPLTEESETSVLRLISDNLYKKHGASVDACLMDYGWSKPKSIWEINAEDFPNGFTRLMEVNHEMGSRIGLWISPGSLYEAALDARWAESQGYEVADRDGGLVLCLGGKRYREAFKQELLKLYSRYDIGSGYFDGWYLDPGCMRTDHGHEPGRLGVEAIVEGLCDAVEAVRKVAPDACLEQTFYGANPSPWWLFYFTTSISAYGDDCPWGRVPCPVYRESYTTGRDFFYMQGLRYNSMPAALQECFGGLYNMPEGYPGNACAEPYITNDLVMQFMRGNKVNMTFANPRTLDERNWATMAKVFAWARKYDSSLDETTPLYPASWRRGAVPKFTNDGVFPREAYGYSHSRAGELLVALRNPWIEKRYYTLDLDDSIGVQAGAAGLSAVSLFPENRLYGSNLRFGDKLRVPVRPYETLVLRIAPGLHGEGLPSGTESATCLRVSGVTQTTEAVEYDYIDQAASPGDFHTVGDTRSSLRCRLQADIRATSPKAELVILIEEKSRAVDPICRVEINGRIAEPIISSPDTGFTQTVLAKPEHWCFCRYRLDTGDNRVSVQLTTRGEAPVVSMWAWAYEDGRIDGNAYEMSLPQPELISLAGALVMPPTDIASLPAHREPTPVERIDGVFLDTVEPSSVSGDLRRNATVGGSAMMIMGRRFYRGLGSAAPSRIAFALDGGYRRFVSWVGCQSEYAGSQSRVAFQVWVDGELRWESTPMSRWEKPQRVDVDIAGARSLELVVVDRGAPRAYSNTKWANWADAVVIR